MKKFLYIIALIAVFVISEYTYNFAIFKIATTYSPFNIYILVSLLGFILLGFILNDECFNILHFKKYNCRVDYIKIFSLFLPFVLISLIPVENILLNADIQMPFIKFSNFQIFGVISGYTLSKSIYLECNGK